MSSDQPPETDRSTARADRYTLEYWADRKRRGLVRVMFVGFFDDVAVPGIIKRVTTRSVFVKLNGNDNVEQFHPGNLRTR